MSSALTRGGTALAAGFFVAVAGAPASASPEGEPKPQGSDPTQTEQTQTENSPQGEMGMEGQQEGQTPQGKLKAQDKRTKQRAGVDRPDAWITAKTKAQLYLAPEVPGTDINVDTVEGAVFLFGEVENRQQAQSAERIARDIQGVKSVNNMITVTGQKSASQTAMEQQKTEQNRMTSDQKKAHSKELKAKVQQALKSDSALWGTNIQVESVKNGKVHLTGQVDTTLEHLAALQTVAEVEGVHGISSDVRERNPAEVISYWEVFTIPTEGRGQMAQPGQPGEPGQMAQDRKTRTADEQLQDTRTTTEAKMQLIANKDVPALDVHVDTNRGEVTLFGIVTSQQAKSAAEESVREVEGVSQVNNMLRVVQAEEAPIPERSDKELKSEVERSLKSHGYDGVEVEAQSGEISLSGSVPTSQDRLRAAVFARSVEGVRSVDESFKVEKAGQSSTGYQKSPKDKSMKDKAQKKQPGQQNNWGEESDMGDDTQRMQPGMQPEPSGGMR